MKRAVVALLVLALVLSVGGVVALSLLIATDEPQSSGPPPAVSVTPDPDSQQPPRSALAPYYEQEPDWQPCLDSFYCATVTVPLDYRRPGGDTIDLALLKRPAEDPSARVGSLVVNPGGPGAPGTDYAAQGDLVFREPLLRHFDIVGFDPRGTGQSAPVDCLTDDQLDAMLASDPSPDDDAEIDETIGYLDDLFAGCAANSGALAGHVSTIEAARDMDVIRAILGESELDYFGASYGTKLGATYADLFPDRVGRFVLDGAVALDLSPEEFAQQQAGGFETALRAYVQNCLDTSDSCFLGDSVEEGLTRIQDFIESVDEAPLPTNGDRDLEVGNAFLGLIAPLYVRDYWFLLSRALQQAFDGNGSALLQLSDLYSSRGPDGYADNSAEAIYAINCLDDPYAVEPADVPALVPAFEQASPTFGDVFAWGMVSCLGETERSTEKPREITATGAAPIVVVGTTRDPATPYAWAQSLAAQLDSGVLVSRDGDGHTGYNSGNDCVDEAIEAYLVEGTVPDDGLSC